MCEVKSINKREIRGGIFVRFSRRSVLLGKVSLYFVFFSAKLPTRFFVRARDAIRSLELVLLD